MTFDELIAQGIRDTLDEERAEYRPEGKKHHFSLAYKIARRNTIISARKRAPLSIRRIRYILLAILFTLFVLLGFGLWRHFGGFSFNVFKEHSKVYYSNENAKTQIEEIYGLPEKYELLSITIGKFDVLSQYMVNEEIITLSQDLISVSGFVNTENISAEYLTINGNDGYYLMVQDVSYVAWFTNNYRFYLSGKIDKNAAVALAESTKIRNFDTIS